MRVLVIDNYDSFTYNLVQYLGELGADPIVWRNDAFTLSEARALKPHAIVVSPGPCTPLEAGRSVEVVRELGPHTPTLGVCLGHQSIGQAFGARVVRAPRLMHGKTSSVRHDATGVFDRLPDGFTATRYHSLIVTDLPDELVPNAWVDEPQGPTDASPPGRTLMGLHHREHPIHGVQFHPESALSEHGHALLENFLKIAR